MIACSTSCPEIGSFSLSELASARGRLGLRRAVLDKRLLAYAAEAHRLGRIKP
ncbi:MAG TPA: DUF2958 domain-containing protein [Candidatus Limnocylindria bacterium]|nr:DUF2958 domain-containing protein [Candidatus Limnocylindria bacterium]